uniref:Uncharacterized protein n=1 Tax=Anguilla anguilla TaxID=7936 RepID=A0A0E9R0F6_ANGAN
MFNVFLHKTPYKGELAILLITTAVNTTSGTGLKTKIKRGSD